MLSSRFTTQMTVRPRPHDVRGWGLVLVLLLLCAATGGEAQSGGHLSGTISDSTGAALPHVTVTIRGPVARVVRTGQDGIFDFPNVPAGGYEIDVTASGFRMQRRSIRMSSGERLSVSITLALLIEEQMVVTASKTGADNLQTTPVAVSVLAGSPLQQAERRSVAHLTGLAPSVTFSQNSDYAQLTIRGIGSNAVFAGTDPSSAVYVDGVYVARPVAILADFLDLERVEVLRGPQGTLYGRNAVGGAMNLITRAPTNDLDASARIVVGSSSTLRTEARVSGPLLRNRIMGSAAVLRGVAEGFVRDLDHPDHPLGGDDVTALSGKLHFALNRRSDLLVAADVTHKDATPLTYAKVLAVKPGFQVDNPPGLHDVRASALAQNRTLDYGGSARFTARLGGSMTLTSLTAFRKLDFDNWNDADITELNLTTGHVRELQHQWSEEATIAQRRGAVTWVAGLFLFDEVDRQPISVQLGGPRRENRLGPDVDASAAAVFGQATIDINSRLSAVAGLRYSRERKSIVNSGQLLMLDPPFTPVPGSAYQYEDAIAHGALTPKAGFDVRIAPAIFTYVSATRGFKSGGFNLTSPEAGRGFAPEWVWSYEAGLKTVRADGRAHANLAVFHTDYSDLQVQTAIRPGVIDISNAAEATIRGIELEGAVRPLSGVQAGGHLAWLDALYDRYVAVGVGGVTGDVSGRRLSNAPEWSGRLWTEWARELGSAGLLTLRADGRWQSTVFFTPFNDAIQRQRAFGVLDAGAEFRPGGRRWSVGAFAHNLTDTGYITGSFSSPPPAIGGRPAEPRQIGIQLTVRSHAR
jgi:iron complex outermembrane receptor protein